MSSQTVHLHPMGSRREDRGTMHLRGHASGLRRRRRPPPTMPGRSSLHRATWGECFRKALSPVRSWPADACSPRHRVEPARSGDGHTPGAALSYVPFFALGSRPVTSLKPCSVEHCLTRYFTHALV